MAQLFLRHLFGGGWAGAFGPSSDVAPDQGGNVVLPFLTDADNVVFELDGGPHMAPGTAHLAGALESGAVIKGLYDFWISGVAGTPVQHRLCHVSTKIKKDDGDGSFSDIVTGLTAGSPACYAALGDKVLMVNGVDTPRKWDGTTASTVSGIGAPSWAVAHQKRLWAGGDPAAPSTLYYSAAIDNASDPIDFAGTGSGVIHIQPSDGDDLVGARSYKGLLILFKGPKKGSIWQLSGRAPTGSDAFALDPMLDGVGAVHQNSLFRFGDDLGFLAPDGSVRSLKATASFGNLEANALSLPIQPWIRDHVNFGRLKHAHAVNWPEYGIVLFALPIDASTNNNILLAMDYRFSPVRWSPWPSFAAVGGSLALVVDATASNRQILLGGGTDGNIRKLGQSSRSIDGATAITYKVTSPFLTYGSALTKKTLEGGSLSVAPKNGGSVTFGWQCDDTTQRTLPVTQGGGSVLGPAASGAFVLDSSTLGGSRYSERFFPLEEGGEFRAIQYQVTGGEVGEDFELHAISAVITPGAASMEN